MPPFWMPCIPPAEHAVPAAPLLQVRAPLEKKLAEDPAFLDTLRSEIESLSLELAAAEQGSS